ncbi:MAG: helicase HerA-like domain-containing protein, partial [Pseudomonadota bacterium]
SKGVGVFFVTQNPIDIPEEVAGQLGNRVQHALRAFTKRDQRAIKAAAETFRINEDLDTEDVITELRVGEALVSTLDEEGAPSVVQRTLIKPPRSRLGPVNAKERAIIQSVSPFAGKYEEAVDRESAEEVLLAKTQDAVDTAAEVEEKGEEEVRKRSRKTKSIWEKAISRGTKVAAGSVAGVAAAAVLGKKSRANPVASGITSAAGSIATDLAGPIAGRFVRNLIGGLMR